MESRSERREALPTRLTEGVCVRGCVLRDVHFAACPDYDKPAGSSTCRGCAPSPAAPGVVVCSRCMGRFRRMLDDVPDLMGRLRSLADPARAQVYSPVRATSSRSEGPAPVGSDLLDATVTIMDNLREWARFLEPNGWHRSAPLAGASPEVAFRHVAAHAWSIAWHLGTIAANPDRIIRLSEAVLDTHVEKAGEGRVWSIADAVARWGVERRDRHVYPEAPIVEEGEVEVVPVHEWFDPIITLADAAKRVELTQRQLRTWVKDGLLDRVARSKGPRGSVVTWVQASQVDAVAERMDGARNSGGRGKARPTAEAVRDTPAPT